MTNNKPTLDDIVQKAVQTWSKQGRTEEQKWAVQNFLTGAGLAIERDFKALMLDIIGEDEKPVWDGNSGEFRDFCLTCDFVPTDDTDHCLCYYRNQWRTEQREKIAAL